MLHQLHSLTSISYFVSQNVLIVLRLSHETTASVYTTDLGYLHQLWPHCSEVLYLLLNICYASELKYPISASPW